APRGGDGPVLLAGGPAVPVRVPRRRPGVDHPALAAAPRPARPAARPAASHPRDRAGPRPCLLRPVLLHGHARPAGGGGPAARAAGEAARAAAGLLRAGVLR